MVIKYILPGAPLWGLLVIFFLLKIPDANSQQFVNGKLIAKKNNNAPSMIYRKYGKEYNNLYNGLGCSLTDYNHFFEFSRIDGFDTLTHYSCSDFVCTLNRSKYGGNYTSDTSTSVLINFNGDTLSDFGFSLKLNSPLLKDSSYELTFLITSDISFKQKFYEKNNYPFENFQIKITQSSSPNIEGDEVALITRSDVFGFDTSISNFKNQLPINNPWFTLDDYFYTVIKKIKGLNNGNYITIKAKLIITDSVSSISRWNLKPNVLDCRNWGVLNKGIHATRFELKCPFEISKSGNLCIKNDPLILTFNNQHPSDRILWSTGETTSNITVNKPGTYWLSKDRNGCKWIDTIIIDSINVIANKNIYYTKCKDSSINIGTDTLEGQHKILWNFGNQKSFADVIKPGIYLRNSYLGECLLTDTFTVTDYPRHHAISTNNYTLCLSDSTTIRGPTQNIEWYKKNLLFSNLQEIKVYGAKDDTLILKSFYECWQFDTIYLNITDCELSFDEYIFVPTAFSPNDDGINDIFKIHGKHIKEIEIYIYNCWGQLVFYTNNVDVGWDGTYQGEIVQNGLYTVTVKVKSSKQSIDITPKTYIKSTLNLLR